MANLLNVFLILVMIISVWPSLVHIAGRLTTPAHPSNLLRPIRRGTIGIKRVPHPTDPPVCMAKLIMLRHRMQQASTRRTQQRIPPVSKPNVHAFSRHRPPSSWFGQASYQTTAGRRWGNNSR